MRLMEQQGFPAGTRVGAQARAWDEAEVEAWLESRRIAAPARDTDFAFTIKDRRLGFARRPPGTVSGHLDQPLRYSLRSRLQARRVGLKP